MIHLRRSTERHHRQRGKHDTWLTFDPSERSGADSDGFGLLAAFSEIRFPPGGVSTPRRPEQAEVVTYVHRGALALQNSTGNSGVVTAGEFHRITIGLGTRHKETNPERTLWAHVFRIALRTFEDGRDGAAEQKRFVAAERHNRLCVVASPDGRKGSLRIPPDVLIYSSVLDRGRHMILELSPGRSAWLHIINGEATLQGTVLTQGDGIGVTAEPSVSLTAQDNTEVLLLDLGPPPKSFSTS